MAANFRPSLYFRSCNASTNVNSTAFTSLNFLSVMLNFSTVFSLANGHWNWSRRNLYLNNSEVSWPKLGDSYLKTPIPEIGTYFASLSCLSMLKATRLRFAFIPVRINPLLQLLTLFHRYAKEIEAVGAGNTSARTVMSPQWFPVSDRSSLSFHTWF